MKALTTFSVVILICMTAPYAETVDDRAFIEYEKQRSMYWSQAEETNRQLKEAERQIETTNLLLKRQQQQLDRQEDLLDRWEKILERHEKVLEVWEKREDKTHNQGFNTDAAKDAARG